VLALSPDGGDEIAVAAAVRTERHVNVEVPDAAHDSTLRGRATSSPPQFGQICSNPSAQAGQNVHS
jgi:hypothetical protein